MSDPGKIVVAGDWHGNALWAMAAISDATRLLHGEAQPLILHLGDFGIWPGPSGQRYVHKVRRACLENGVTLGFIDGNHEDFTQLHRFDVRKAPAEPTPGLWHLPRNTRWTWHERTWHALGGAASVDRAIRHEGVSWWPQEEITGPQAREAISAGPADVLVTHDCPAGVQHYFPPPPSFWAQEDLDRSEAHRELLQGVVDAVQPRWLMHGHLHRAYQRECDFGYGPVEVTGLDCDGRQGLGVNYLVLDVRTMTWETPGQLRRRYARCRVRARHLRHAVKSTHDQMWVQLPYSHHCTSDNAGGRAMAITGVQPGDVLAVRTPGAWSSAMIRLGAAFLDKPNLSNHVAVVHHWDRSGTLWVIEGRPGGVGWRDARDYLSSPWTLSNVAQPKTDAQRKVITDGAMAMLGMPYDWAAIIGDGLDDLHLWNPVHGQVQGHAVCSAVAAFLYDKAVLARPAGDERRVQPADWDSWCLTQAWAATVTQ